ncbi:MAG TPA: hypothetical protein VEZ90_18145 [Blastocatellia bacterium]|nr:hypothetical protein [Blastocatellia bacterium]
MQIDRHENDRLFHSLPIQCALCPALGFRAQFRSSALIVGALFLLCSVPGMTKSGASAISTSQDESKLYGDWSGESLCQQTGTACKNEKVVYHITRSKQPSKVTITADKIVDGHPVTMGSGDWDYDEQKQTLTWNNWTLRIKGHRIDGTLAGNDGTLIRKMWLKKDEK